MSDLLLILLPSSGYSRPRHIAPGASASCALPPIGYTKRSQVFSTWSIHLRRGRPLHHQTSTLVLNIFFTGASSFIRTTYPSQRIRCIVMRRTTSMSSFSSYSSWFIRIQNSSPARSGSKILRRIFLSNTPSAAASVCDNTHASAPYKSRGRVLLLSVERELCYTSAY